MIIAKTDDISLSTDLVSSHLSHKNVMLVRTSGVEVFLVGRKRIPQAVICARAFLGNVQLAIGLKVYLG